MIDGIMSHVTSKKGQVMKHPWKCIEMNNITHEVYILTSMMQTKGRFRFVKT